MYKTDLKRASEEQKNRRKEIPVGMKELEFDLNLVEERTSERKHCNNNSNSYLVTAYHVPIIVL